jgi:glycosyltransferase involved in cell wall biosynthesis
MVNVCMVVHKYYYQDPRVRRYTEALVEAGARVDVVCLHALGAPARSGEGRLRVYTIPFSRGARRISYAVEYGAAFVLYFVWVLALHLRNRYRVIHVHNMPDFLVFAALIPRLLGARVILDIHDPTPEFYMSKHGPSDETLRVKAMRAQEWLSALAADAIITANSAFKSSLERRGLPGSRITVVNNIADPRIFNPAHYSAPAPALPETLTLLYPGTIAPRYGLHIAVQALPLLIARFPDLRLRIVGQGDSYIDELAALAAELGVAEHLELLPPIPPTKVPAEMLRATIGIYPALPDPHMAIATPSKVLEYVAMGLPVVASRLPALEVLFDEDAVRFVQPGDAQAFARGVLDLLEQPACRVQLARNAAEALRGRHTWEHERGVYFALLNRLAYPSPAIEARPVAEAV